MNIAEMSVSSEVRPFIPAVLELQCRLKGIEDECESLGLLIERACETEEQMLLALLSQRAFALTAVNEAGDRWDVTTESFADFRARSHRIEFLDTGSDLDKLNQISLWIIQLCDWDNTLQINVGKH